MSTFPKWSKDSQADIEKALEDMYSQMLSQLPNRMTLEQAYKEVKKAIETCKNEAIKEGTANLPKNYGDLLLDVAKSGDLKAQKIVDKARKEGATDKNIQEFWNLTELERRMVFWSENVFRYASFLSAREEDGLSENDAILRVRKMFPMYGDPEDSKNTSGDDRPLPHEIRGRIDKYRQQKGAKYISEKVKDYSSYNAFIRDEIRKGQL